jgi:hypothetical protein
MGVRNATVQSNTIVAVNPANGVETIICTTGIMGLVQDNAIVLIQFYAFMAVGASATLEKYLLRRGAALTSTLLNANVQNSVVASTANMRSGCYFDSPGIAGQVQYSLTYTVSGGAAAGQVNDVCLIAMVL